MSGAAQVSMQDFEAALDEVKPAFGSDKASLETYRLNGIIPYSDAFTHLLNTARMLVQQVRARHAGFQSAPPKQ